VKKTFLVEKGTHKGKPLSVKGIQKCMEYYAKKAGAELVVIEKNERLIQKFPNLQITLNATKLRTCNKIVLTIIIQCGN